MKVVTRNCTKPPWVSGRFSELRSGPDIQLFCCFFSFRGKHQITAYKTASSFMKSSDSEVFEINVTNGSLILDLKENRVEQLVSEHWRVWRADASQMLLHCRKSSSCRAKGAWIDHKNRLKKWASYAYFNVGGSKTHPKKSLITWECMSIILLMHEQTLNDPWPNITYPLHKYWMCIRTNKKGHKNVHLWFQQTWLKKKVFPINGDWGKKEWNPNSFLGAQAIVMMLVQLLSWIASSLLPLGCKCW